MTAPRKNPDLVNAPVLFRLPNLHAVDEPVPQQAGGAPWATPPQYVAPPRPQPLDSAAAAYRSASAAEAPHVFSTKDVPPESTPSHTSEIFTRPVILLAMALVACGGWIAGRQTAHQTAGHPAQSAIAAHSPSGDSGQRGLDGAVPAAVQSRSADTAANNSAADGSPETKSSPRSAAGQESAGFYLADDELAAPQQATSPATAQSASPQSSAPAVTESDNPVEPREPAEANDPASVFAAISLDTLTAPANQSSPTGGAPVAPVAEATETASEASPPADEQAVARKVPDLSTAAGDAEPLQADEGVDADSAASSDSQGSKQRRVLSPTPNDIPDWSRYFIGGTGPVRSASAEGLIDQPGALPAGSQAFYLDAAGL